MQENDAIGPSFSFGNIFKIKNLKFFKNLQIIVSTKFGFWCFKYALAKSRTVLVQKPKSRCLVKVSCQRVEIAG